MEEASATQISLYLSIAIGILQYEAFAIGVNFVASGVQVGRKDVGRCARLGMSPYSIAGDHPELVAAPEQTGNARQPRTFRGLEAVTHVPPPGLKLRVHADLS